MGVTIYYKSSHGYIHEKIGAHGKKGAKVYPLVCDKISITCNFPEHVAQIIAHNFKQEGAKKKGLYYLSLNIDDIEKKAPPYCDTNVTGFTSAFIQCAPTTSGHKFFRIEFNPAKIANMAEFKAYLDGSWLTVSEYGSDYVFNNGTVTRGDFAVDIAHEQINEFLYYYRKMQIVEVVQSKSGRTEYIGGKHKTGKRIAIYDRVPAIKNANKKAWKESQKMPVPDFPVMRIEIRLRPNCLVHELDSIENPFKNLVVSSYANLENKDEMWDLFLALARFEGAQASLGRLSKERKKEYVKFLEKGQAVWWNPEHIWTQAAAALQELDTISE